MNSSDKVSIASAIIKTLPMPVAQLLVSSYYAKDNLFFRIDEMQLPLVDELRRGTYMDFLGKLRRKDVQEIYDVHLINFSPNGEYLAIAHNDTVLTFYKKESQREAFEKRGSMQFQNRIELFELEVNMEGPMVVVYEKGPSEGMYTKTLLSLRTSDKLNHMIFLLTKLI